MSKYVKNLITKELTGRLKDIDGVAVINPRGIDGNQNNSIRRKLHAKKLRMTVVKNTLVKRAVGDGKLKGFDALLDGPSAVIYGQASIAEIARLILEEKKTNDKLELRGVFFDGEVYAGDKGVEAASKLPTREEAIANIVGAILGPGKKLAAALKGPGGTLGAVLKTIEAKAKERGDAEPAPAAAEAAAPAPEAAPAGEPPAGDAPAGDAAAPTA
jgi:large subunit ribosomal protein L10